MSIEQAIAFHRAGRLAEAERVYRSLLAANQHDPDALHFYGVLRAQTGDVAGAINLIERSLAVDPDAPQSHFHLASILSNAGHKAEALAHFERTLALQPGYLQAQLGRIDSLIDLGRARDALALCREVPAGAQLADLRGRALMATKAHDEALTAFDEAVALKPDFVDAHYHRADVLHALGRNEDALAALAHVLTMKPGFAEAQLARGNVLLALDRPQEALGAVEAALALKADLAEAHCAHAAALRSGRRAKEALEASERAIALKPDLHEGHLRRSEALLELNRCDEALAAAQRAVGLRSDLPECHNARGSAFARLGRAEEALAAFDRALALKPDAGATLVNRACALLDLDRTDEAQADFVRAIERDPGSETAFYNLGNLLSAQNRHEEALAAFDSAIALKPGWTEALHNRAYALDALGREEESLAAWDQALAIDPDLSLARSKRLTIRAGNCDWHGRFEDLAALKRFCAEAERVDPFAAIFAFDDPLLHLKAARVMAGPTRPHGEARRSHERLRIAYLSPDFREHPVAHQVVELLERHDRSRFEIAGICLKPEAASPIRDRIRNAFEHFHEVQQRTDAGIAKLLEDLEIDIAVDLAGYTDKGRTKALSWRTVPVTVNYLGYSGTLGADYIDYIIADPYVVPTGHEGYFSEKVVRLPYCFFPSDSKGRGEAAPTRAAEGLPDEAFVFCTFNNTYKITPEMFDVWMRLLQAVEDSVLWLRVEKPVARGNLRLEAEQRGVSAERLIFGARAPRELHLARIALADLFLDSTPYNAHTTANDALWAGLPLVTCPGLSFASRVAGSMLTVSGVPELIAPDLADYERLALELARSPERLKALRQRLVEGRSRNPLFDVEGLCRQLESAYATMWDIHTTGQKPHDFSVNMGT